MTPDKKIERCSRCRCTDDDACPGGCFWIRPGLCSACATVAEINAWAKDSKGSPAAARALERGRARKGGRS